MIFDRLPQDVQKCYLLNLAYPVVAPLVGSDYVFNAVNTLITGKGSTLYYFDSYTLSGSITQESFAESAGAGLLASYEDFMPVFNIQMDGYTGSALPNFSPIRPTCYGQTFIRQFAEAPSISKVIATGSVKGRLKQVASMGAPASITMFYGVNVYVITDQDFIELYHKKGYGCLF